MMDVRFTVLAILVALIVAVRADAHSFYSAWCCNDKDCAPVATDAITWTEDGWLIVDSGEVIPWGDSRINASPDGQYHRCVIAGKTRCIYVPMGNGT